tara:strand:+ start:1255 stop:2151 length:897 start_codon:yes stop_codon:yes gene_type:complete
MNKFFGDKFPLTNASMKDHVKKQFNKLISVDKIRMHKLLFIMQYTLLYVFVGLGLGSALDHLFPDYDSEKENMDILKELTLQTLVIGVTLFYARKLVKVVPYLFNFDNSFSSSHAQNIPEYQGTLILGLVFVATQTSYLKKIQHLSKNVIIKKLKNEDDDYDDANFIAQNSKPIEVQSNELQATNPNQIGNNTRMSKGIDTSLLHQGAQQNPTFNSMGYHQDSQSMGQMAMLSGGGTVNNLNSSNNQHSSYQASNNPNTMNMLNSFADPSPFLSGDTFGDSYSYLDNDYNSIRHAAYI